MKNILFLFLFFITFVTTVLGETAPVSVRLPEEKAWVGQRVPFFIELRAPGSFQGTASFDVPQLPGTTIIKIGSPVVSSEEIDGQSWFVQAHEFALFSQNVGVLEVPPFTVRFASRTGFTGPASDVQAKFPGMKVEIKRPAGSEKIGFLVTTESLEITEKWEPQPGSVQVGAIFKRTIGQRASQLSGMALVPPPTSAPDGIRVYTEDASIKDKTERGDLLGERSDTITYQLIEAGSFVLPELTYVWWNPKTEKMQMKTLPSVIFNVYPAPSASPAANLFDVSFSRIMILLLVLAIAMWQRKKILGWLQQCWKKLHPVDKALAKQLIRACKQNNGIAASQAWLCWRNTQGAGFQPGSELQSCVFALQRHLYGPESSAGSWEGKALCRAFTKHLNTTRKSTLIRKVSTLPQLNYFPC